MKAIHWLLYTRNAIQAFALFSMPIIRFVGQIVGATNAMRVYAISKSGTTIEAHIVHLDLGECVGLATSAFCLEVIKENVPAGIWYPTELPQQARTNILEAAKEDTISYQVIC